MLICALLVCSQPGALSGALSEVLDGLPVSCVGSRAAALRKKFDKCSHITKADCLLSSNLGPI